LDSEIDKSSSNLCMSILNCVQLEGELIKLDNEISSNNSHLIYYTLPYLHVTT
jgi:hypothetical protein